MKLNAEIFARQFPLVKWFIYHLIYYRELHRQNNRRFKTAFWVFTIDGHLLQATSYWCMVFGGYNNPTHWKHLAVGKKNEDLLRQGFTKAVLALTGFTEENWQNYWQEIVNFRNKYVSHRDNFKKPVPHFDQALAVAYAYDRWVREELFPGIWEEPPLKESAERAKEDVKVFVKEFLTGEKPFPQNS